MARVGGVVVKVWVGMWAGCGEVARRERRVERREVRWRRGVGRRVSAVRERGGGMVAGEVGDCCGLGRTMDDEVVWGRWSNIVVIELERL